jgi:hypothetical protein
LIAEKQFEYLEPVLTAAYLREMGLLSGPVDFNYDQKTYNFIINDLADYIMKFYKSEE